MALTALTLACGADDSAVGPGSTEGPALDVFPQSASAPTDGEVEFGVLSGESSTAAANLRLVRLDLNPTSARVSPGGVTDFDATGRTFTGRVVKPTVRWRATGGQIDSNGKFTAGRTPGGYRVIASTSEGVADTAAVTVTAAAPPAPPPPSSPPPSGGKVFFSADAESGTTSPWASGWGVVSDGSSPRPAASQTRARSGRWSYKYEAVGSKEPHYSQTLSGEPQSSMGSRNGRYLSGYYSFWAYIDEGYTAPGWNMLLGWMTGVQGSPSPISHVGLEVWNGQLQVVYVLKNCSVGLYACPNIAGYKNTGGWYTMTSSSPAGIVPFPRNKWVHLSFYYKMSPTNGQLTVWQDGVKIMDLAASSMNTFGGHSIDPLRNAAGDMMLQFGNYGGSTSSGTQRLYIDDFRVTDYRPTP